MEKANRHVERPVAKPVLRRSERDLYDPHFAPPRRAKNVPGQTHVEIFDPHFPPRPRN
jgi:hypothetical protein